MADRRVIPRTTGLILEMKASISWMTGAILANARVIPRMTGLIFGMKGVILGMMGAILGMKGVYPRIYTLAQWLPALRDCFVQRGATSGSLVPESSNRSCRRWQSARGRGRTHPPFARALARAMTASSVRRARSGGNRDGHAPDRAIAVAIVNREQRGIRARCEPQRAHVPDVFSGVLLHERAARRRRIHPRHLNRHRHGGRAFCGGRAVIVPALDPLGEMGRTPALRRLRGDVQRGLPEQAVGSGGRSIAGGHDRPSARIDLFARGDERRALVVDPDLDLPAIRDRLAGRGRI